jgi:hypothetical protein
LKTISLKKERITANLVKIFYIITPKLIKKALIKIRAFKLLQLKLSLYTRLLVHTIRKLVVLKKLKVIKHQK